VNTEYTKRTEDTEEAKRKRLELTQFTR